RRGSFRRVWRRACANAGFEPLGESDKSVGKNGGDKARADRDRWPLEGLVFHELRHTAAALAIAQGAHPLAIRERLGHSSITVTLDRYGGLFPSLDEALADALDGVLRDSLAASPRPEPARLVSLRR